MKNNQHGTHKDGDSCNCTRSYPGNPPKLSICFWWVRFLAVVVKGAWAKKYRSEHLVEMYQWVYVQVTIASPTNARCLHLNIFFIFFFPSKRISASLVNLSSPGYIRTDLNARCEQRSFIEIFWYFAMLGNILAPVSCLSVWIIAQCIWLSVETN